jgi:hypothetical protein
MMQPVEQVAQGNKKGEETLSFSPLFFLLL